MKGREYFRGEIGEEEEGGGDVAGFPLQVGRQSEREMSSPGTLVREARAVVDSETKLTMPNRYDDNGEEEKGRVEEIGENDVIGWEVALCALAAADGCSEIAKHIVKNSTKDTLFRGMTRKNSKSRSDLGDRRHCVGDAMNNPIQSPPSQPSRTEEVADDDLTHPSTPARSTENVDVVMSSDGASDADVDVDAAAADADADADTDADADADADVNAASGEESSSPPNSCSLTPTEHTTEPPGKEPDSPLRAAPPTSSTASPAVTVGEQSQLPAALSVAPSYTIPSALDAVERTGMRKRKLAGTVEAALEASVEAVAPHASIRPEPLLQAKRNTASNSNNISNDDLQSIELRTECASTRDATRGGGSGDGLLTSQPTTDQQLAPGPYSKPSSSAVAIAPAAAVAAAVAATAVKATVVNMEMAVESEGEVERTAQALVSGGGREDAADELPVCEHGTCEMPASFGMKSDGRVLRCSRHYTCVMMDLLIRRCPVERCDRYPPTFGFPGQVGASLVCEFHRREGMLDLGDNLCQRRECTSRPTPAAAAAAHRENGHRRQRPSLFCDKHALDAHGTPIQKASTKRPIAAIAAAATTLMTTKAGSATSRTTSGKLRAQKVATKANSSSGKFCGSSGSSGSKPRARKGGDTSGGPPASPSAPLALTVQGHKEVAQATAAAAAAMEARTVNIGIEAPYFVTQEPPFTQQQIAAMSEDPQGLGFNNNYAPVGVGGRNRIAGGAGYLGYGSAGRGGDYVGSYGAHEGAYGGASSYGGPIAYGSARGAGYGGMNGYPSGGYLGGVGGRGGNEYGGGAIATGRGDAWRGSHTGGGGHMGFAFPQVRSHHLLPRDVYDGASPMLELPDISMGGRASGAARPAGDAGTASTRRV